MGIYGANCPQWIVAMEVTFRIMFICAGYKVPILILQYGKTSKHGLALHISSATILASLFYKIESRLSFFACV